MKERQLEILEAAGTILNEKGLGGLTIKNLSKQIGFVESAIYRHYKSKEHIVVALLDYMTDAMKLHLIPFSTMDVTADVKLRKLFNHQLKLISDNPHFQIGVFSEGMLNYSDLINEKIRQLTSFVSDLIGKIIFEGQKEGTFTADIPRAELASILIGAFRFFIQRWRIAEVRFDLQSKGKSHVDSIISLIEKK